MPDVVFDPDRNTYPDIRHAFTLELLRRQKSDRIEFGYVTRLLNLTSSNS